MIKYSKGLTFYYCFISFFLTSDIDSFGQIVNTQRDGLVIEGNVSQKEKELKSYNNFRDIGSKDQRSMNCLLFRNSCIQKCRKIYGDQNQASDSYKMEENKTDLFFKKKCIYTCNWNRDICAEQY